MESVERKHSPPGIRSGYEPDSGRQVIGGGWPETVRAIVGQTKGKAGASAGTNDLTASGRGGSGGSPGTQAVARPWKNFGRPKFVKTTPQDGDGRLGFPDHVKT